MNWKLIPAVLAAVLLAACATQSLNDDASAQERRAAELAERHFVVGEEIDSVSFGRTIDGWGYIDNKALWVTSSPNRYYLLTLSFPCHDLKWAEGIGLKSSTSRLSWGDDILVRGAGNTVRTCKIDQIHEMTKEKPADSEEQAVE